MITNPSDPQDAHIIRHVLSDTQADEVHEGFRPAQLTVTQGSVIRVKESWHTFIQACPSLQTHALLDCAIKVGIVRSAEISSRWTSGNPLGKVPTSRAAPRIRKLNTLFPGVTVSWFWAS